MTDLQEPIINLAELELEHWQEGTFFESHDASFGAQLGLKDLGIGYGEVPPGKSGCPFHNHHIEEELFVILSGEGRIPLRPEPLSRQGRRRARRPGGRPRDRP